MWYILHVLIVTLAHMCLACNVTLAYMCLACWFVSVRCTVSSRLKVSEEASEASDDLNSNFK